MKNTITLSYLHLGLKRSCCQKRRLTNQHLIKDNTNTPPITQLGVTWTNKKANVI